MFSKKRIFVYVSVILYCFFSMGFSQPTILSKNYNNVKITAKQNLTMKVSSDLKTWVGDYTFSEYAPPDQNRFFSISIYRENNNYFAKIGIDGFQTLKRLLATVSGDKKAINLGFLEYLPDNMFEPYEKGDILLSFKKNDSILITKWGKIRPLLLKNRKPGEYFKLDSSGKK